MAVHELWLANCGDLLANRDSGPLGKAAIWCLWVKPFRGCSLLRMHEEDGP